LEGLKMPSNRIAAHGTPNYDVVVYRKSASKKSDKGIIEDAAEALEGIGERTPPPDMAILPPPMEAADPDKG
jgi:hypothetical protein